ncbi:phosphopantothenoylcysteine decarboxylase domain-containing protein [Hymenobacter psychrotolerans]|uniref:Phosphopantothenoylcysteine decarboxylase / phosphopantothenate--cysteine ligase n=1 Tax=Hymenobacter psychrotolerans DSM 18569 TaxID=1121959 RepID=A0A1M7BKI3_9BACT|nr:phosphopantothenoylcysteine decarboxylase [Hymenobacter psychrotolerans]SHL55548.1 phosphopantothenoylcysteine decarboxylase / phosphopantothenate--cysteine ligase [Hymenobacter psychrotolerans DSM 18569]
MRVLITAGPTYEPLDPVRFIGNHSTGKMGYALAEAFAASGAAVTLISGPSNLPDPAHPGIQTQRVETADQMYAAAAAVAPEAGVWVFAAAVADYKPAQIAAEKIKKSGDTLTLELVKNVDIAATLGKTKRPEQFSVGFALETNNEHAHALDKLHRKNFDLVVLNSLRDAGAGFRHDTNKVTLLDAQGQTRIFEVKPKAEVAQDIVDAVLARLPREV